MHLLPASSKLLPDPRLAAARRQRISIRQLLRQPGVAQHHGLISGHWIERMIDSLFCGLNVIGRAFFRLALLYLVERLLLKSCSLASSASFFLHY